MRSVDLILGLPADIKLYAALLLLICAEVAREPGDLIFMMGDAHVYENHVETYLDLPQLLHKLPKWELSEDAGINHFTPDMLELINYRHGEKVTYELNV
jgi:thymidylate synthase